MNSTPCSIFFHNYYGQHEDWVNFFCQKLNIPFILFYNIVEDSVINLEEDHRLMDRLRQAASGPHLQKIILRRSPNQGKDIGGKLVLLDAYRNLGTDSDHIIFLHDKKSPYKAEGLEWREKLFRIVEPFFVEKALAFFNEEAGTGIISTTESILDEYDFSTLSFASNNKQQLTQLRAELAIDNTDFRYVAGTMFWVRSSPLLSFFNKYPPLEIRKTLEKGNVMDEKGGSITHAWERMLCWLIFAQGYTLKGL